VTSRALCRYTEKAGSLKLVCREKGEQKKNEREGRGEKGGRGRSLIQQPLHRLVRSAYDRVSRAGKRERGEWFPAFHTDCSPLRIAAIDPWGERACRMYKERREGGEANGGLVERSDTQGERVRSRSPHPTERKNLPSPDGWKGEREERSLYYWLADLCSHQIAYSSKKPAAIPV